MQITSPAPADKTAPADILHTFEFESEFSPYGTVMFYVAVTKRGLIGQHRDIMLGRKVSDDIFHSYDEHPEWIIQAMMCGSVDIKTMLTPDGEVRANDTVFGYIRSHYTYDNTDLYYMTEIE